MLSEKNKDAIKSSVLVGVAEACFAGLVVYLANKSIAMVVGTTIVGFVIGVTVGLLTTWYIEE